MKKLFTFALTFIFSAHVIAQSKSDYVGSYRFSSGPIAKLVISLNGSTLIAEAEEVGKGEIFVTDKKDQFTEPENEALLIFNRDSMAVVISVSIKVQGDVLLGIKEIDPRLAFVGKYKFDENAPVAEMTVEIKDGDLFGNTDQGGGPMKPSKDKDVFNLEGYDGTATFSRRPNGQVSGVTVKIQGMTLVAKKR